MRDMQKDSDILEISKPVFSSTKQELKKTRLIQLVQSVLRQPRYKARLAQIAEKLYLKEEKIIENFLYYNLDLSVRNNKEYGDIYNRFVLHLHNLLPGSWHQRKQTAIENFLKKNQFNSIIDVGFGVPTRYIHELVIKLRKPHVTLSDLYDTAFIFSEVLLQEWDKNWERIVSFQKVNMDNMEYLGDFDAYIFQDCIEHTKNPTDYLKKQVQLSPIHSMFGFILAIGPLIPMHHIAWETEAIATNWLYECGLMINESFTIKTNPEVDLFASETPFSFMFFSCSKFNHE